MTFTKHFAHAQRTSGRCRRPWLCPCGISGGSRRASPLRTPGPYVSLASVGASDRQDCKDRLWEMSQRVSVTPAQRPAGRVPKDGAEGVTVRSEKPGGMGVKAGKVQRAFCQAGACAQSYCKSTCLPGTTGSGPREHPRAAPGFLQEVAQPGAQEAGLNFDSPQKAGDGG